MNELKQLEEKELLEVLHTNKTLLISLIDKFKSKGFRIPEEVLNLKDNVGRSERMSAALSKRLTGFVSKNKYKRVAIVNFALKEFLDKYEGVERIKSSLKERELSPFQKEALNYMKGFRALLGIELRKRINFSFTTYPEGSHEIIIKSYVKELNYLFKDNVEEEDLEKGISTLVKRHREELNDYFKEEA